MDRLKAKMEETRALLKVIDECLQQELLVPEKTLAAGMQDLEALRTEQQRCVRDVCSAVHCEEAACTGIAAMEALLAEHDRQKEQLKELRRIAAAFDRAVGSQVLEQKTDAELLAMEQNGELGPYRSFLSTFEQAGIAKGKEDTAEKQSVSKAAQEPAPVQGALPQPQAPAPAAAVPSAEASAGAPADTAPADAAPAGAAAPTEAPAPEDAAVAAPLPAEQAPEAPAAPEDVPPAAPAEAGADDGAPASVLPCSAAPAYTVTQAKKIPKGEASFLGIRRSKGPAVGNAFTNIAYFLINEGTARRSFIEQFYEKKYTRSIIDQALALLCKEGYAASYRLDSEPSESVSYFITPAGFRVLAKENLQHKLNRKVRRYGPASAFTASECLRLQKMNDLYVAHFIPSEEAVVRSRGGGFAAMQVCTTDETHCLVCYLPLLFADGEKESDLTVFLADLRKYGYIDGSTVILAEVKPGTAADWAPFLQRSLNAEARYYFGDWGQASFADGEGSVLPLEYLWQHAASAGAAPAPAPEPMPGSEAPAAQKTAPESAAEPNAKASPAADAASAEPAERGHGDEARPAPKTDTPAAAQAEPTPKAEAPAAAQPEPAPKAEAPAAAQAEPAPKTEAPAAAQAEPAPKTEAPADTFVDPKSIPLRREQSVRQTARQLLAQPDPLADTALLDDMILRLVAAGRTMEALVFAKTLADTTRHEHHVSRYLDLLHATGLSLGQLDYAAYLTHDGLDDDEFDWYCKVGAAIRTACFPKMPYDHNLYNSIDGMIVKQMDLLMPPELTSVKTALNLLTGELKPLSFDKGDGAGLSATILDTLASGAVQEKKRKKLMADARQKMNTPRSNIQLTGFEALTKSMMGPTGELGRCMKAIAEDATASYGEVSEIFHKFVDGDGKISIDRQNEYIDKAWDALRKKDRAIQITRFTNESPARNMLLREIGKRLEYMDEWLKRNQYAADGVRRPDGDAFRSIVGRLTRELQSAVATIDYMLRFDLPDVNTAGLRVLRDTLDDVRCIINNQETVTDAVTVFAPLLTTRYLVLDDSGEPVLDAAFNDLPGMEPWRLVLEHIVDEHVPYELALQQTDDPDMESDRYEDYGSAAVLRRVLGMEAEDRISEEKAALDDCREREVTFRGTVRLACAYGQIAEESKETLFALLSRYRSYFIPEGSGTADAAESEHAYGNYAHFRMLLRCLYAQMEQERSDRRAHYLGQYESYAAGCKPAEVPPVLQRARQEIESGNFAMAEEFFTRYISGERELPQEIGYMAGINFHAQFIDCAPWYYEQCSMPEHKGDSLRNWGVKSLSAKNFWSGGNERAGAEQLLANWLTKRGAANNAARIRQLLIALGFTARNVVPDTSRPADTKYEVFSAEITSAAAGKEDYSHPIAKYGTQQPSPLHVVCVYGCKGTSTIINIMTSRLQLGGNTVVLMDGSLTMLERRDLAARFKKETSSQNGFLLIDRVLILYLAALDAGSRLNALLQCTLPYTYEQPYSEGSGMVADEMFIGRIADRKSLCDPNGACLVYGGRQLGKTALLHRVESINHKPADGQYAVYLDVKDQGADYFVRQLKKKLLTIDTPRGSLLNKTEQTLEDICDSLRENADRYVRLTILVDEVDAYFEEISASNYNALHPAVVLQEELKGKIKFVFSGTHNVAATSKGYEENADLLKLRQPLCIKPLSPADATQLIRYPLSYLGFEIGEQQIALILANTNSYPGLIHLFCNALVKSVCENYGKYYSSQGGNPPYTVSDEQLRAIFTEKDIKKEIRQRVFATITLNPKYLIVASLLAFLEYQGQENATPRLYGYSPRELQECNSREFKIRDFMPENMKVEDLATLMDEMEKMGILWKNPNEDPGTYRFRQRDFLGYIGSYDRVLEILLGGG